MVSKNIIVTLFVTAAAAAPETGDYIIETEVEEAGVKAVLNIYSRTAEIAGWSIVEVLQNAVSPIVF